MTDKEIFISVVPYKNFITPTVEGYVRKGDYICEISCGEAFGGGTAVGVTVVNAKTRTHEHELCKSNSYPTYDGALAWAKEYINNLLSKIYDEIGNLKSEFENKSGEKFFGWGI